MKIYDEHTLKNVTIATLILAVAVAMVFASKIGFSHLTDVVMDIYPPTN